MGRFAVPVGQRAQRYRKKIGNILYSNGGSPGIPGGVPKSGYSCAFDLRSNIQVVTTATPPVIANYGAYGPAAMVNLIIGTQLPFSMPMYYSKVWHKVYDPPAVDSLVSSPVAASLTNNWVNDVRIPATVDPNTEIGAWYTGDQELNLDLQMTGAAPGTVFSTLNGATIQGSWDVWVERFNAPDPASGGWLNEVSFYHEVKLYATYNLKNGDTMIPLPIGGDYQRIYLQFYTGSNKDATFNPLNGLYTQISLVVNDTLYPYERIDEATLRMEMLRNYQNVLDPGAAVLDFMAARLNSRRDVIPTDPDLVHALYLVVTSTSSANNVDVIVERTLDSPYAAKWIAAAASRKAA